MRYILLGWILISCTACAAQIPYVELRGQRFTVELAQTQDEQALGLMFRESLPEDHGMLFIFPREAPRFFWMKNTRIPLDILYFDEQLQLVSMSENTPPCRSDPCPNYPSVLPAKYVLELIGGRASQLGVEVGDELTLHLD